MRSDGTITFWFIQFKAIKPEPEWLTADLGHFLFTDPRPTGEEVERLRALIEPQSASSDLWQRYGIHGFEEKDDALAVLRELRRRGQREFRLVRRTIEQVTVIEPGHPNPRAAAQARAFERHREEADLEASGMDCYGSLGMGC